MAAESNTGFHHEGTLGSALSRHAISFQSGAINSTSEMIPIANYYGLNSAAGMMFSGNSSILNNNPGISQSGNSSGSLLLDSEPALKHDTGLAVEWSVEEQYKLEEGLVKYADEPSIMRYIKIAATLREKTVRDVALRCRWMTVFVGPKAYIGSPSLVEVGRSLCGQEQRKRRKQEEQNLGKKMKDKRDKLVESSSKTNMSSVSPSNLAAYSLIMNHKDRNENLPFEALSGTTRHLLEQNNQVLGQISANLSTLKLQDNLDLLFRTRNNIATILNAMREMPGIMSQMPSLPVSINDELANSILPSTSQAILFGLSSAIHPKQEPGC